MKLRGKILLQKPLHVGMEVIKYGNKVEITTQKKTNLVQKDGREERQKITPHVYLFYYTMKCVEQMYVYSNLLVSLLHQLFVLHVG